ncbi:uncharacterized protein KZ484_022661 isoform 2-T2 [Pholidichthys leucotaenia]
MVRLIFLCLLLLLCQLKPSTGDQDSDDYNRCTAAPDPGFCRAAFPMYYYDTKTDSCENFIYGGCGGNDNRYNTLEECKSSCIGDGQFETRGKTRSHWTAAFFLLVALAVISIVLLVMLVILLRRRRHPGCSSSVSDKEELLKGELSSLDSLSMAESPKPDPKA